MECLVLSGARQSRGKGRSDEEKCQAKNGNGSKRQEGGIVQVSSKLTVSDWKVNIEKAASTRPMLLFGVEFRGSGTENCL